LETNVNTALDQNQYDDSLL